MSSVITIAREGGITLGGNIFENIIRFVFLIAVTRVVSQTTYGQFTLAVSIIIFSYQIFDFNMANAIDYFVPENIQQGKIGVANAVLRKGLILGTVTTLIGAGVVIWIAPTLGEIFGEPRLVYSLIVLSLTIPILGLFRIFLATFASIKKLKYRAYTQNIIRPSVRLILTIGLIFIIDDLTALLIGFAVALLVSTIIASYYLFRAAPNLIRASTGQMTYGSLMSYSWPLIFSGMVYATIGHIDFFVIGYFLPSADVGAYKVGFALTSTLIIFLSSLRRIHKPVVAENKGDNEKLQFHYQLITRWGILLVVPPALTLLLAPETYLTLFFTQEYATAGAAVSILAVRYLLLAGFGPQGKTLEGIGYTRFVLINSSIILLLNGILDILLIPIYGIAGAAIGTTIATAIGSIAGVIELKYYRDIWPVGLVHIKLWISAITTIIVGYTVTQAISGLLLAGILPIIVVALNFILLRLMGAFTEEDKDIARKIDKKIGYTIVQRLITN